jgi:transposase-like protein
MPETSSEPNQTTTQPRWTPGIAKKMITGWKRSGLSQAAFCRREAISLSTLNYWIRKTRQSKRKARKHEKPHFVEVKDTRLPSFAQHPVMELATPSGYRLSLPSGFSADDLHRALSALNATAC